MKITKIANDYFAGTQIMFDNALDVQVERPIERSPEDAIVELTKKILPQYTEDTQRWNVCGEIASISLARFSLDDSIKQNIEIIFLDKKGSRIQKKYEKGHIYMLGEHAIKLGYRPLDKRIDEIMGVRIDAFIEYVSDIKTHKGKVQSHKGKSFADFKEIPHYDTNAWALKRIIFSLLNDVPIQDTIGQKAFSGFGGVSAKIFNPTTERMKEAQTHYKIFMKYVEEHKEALVSASYLVSVAYDLKQRMPDAESLYPVTKVVQNQIGELYKEAKSIVSHIKPPKGLEKYLI